MAKENRTVVQRLEDFCNLCTDSVQDYNYYYDEVNRLDKLTQDYLHIMELDDLKYGERAKLATKLSECRRERREAKDNVEVLQSLVDYLFSDAGLAMTKALKTVLGKTRQMENYHKTRSYKFRILQDDANK